MRRAPLTCVGVKLQSLAADSTAAAVVALACTALAGSTAVAAALLLLAETVQAAASARRCGHCEMHACVIKEEKYQKEECVLLRYRLMCFMTFGGSSIFDSYCGCEYDLRR